MHLPSPIYSMNTCIECYMLTCIYYPPRWLNLLWIEIEIDKDNMITSNISKISKIKKNVF